MKILIPHDATDASLVALDDLPRAGLPREAAALVVKAIGVVRYCCKNCP